jgi:Raf kinase inhibitor-like YbhB/YbcL family protein
MATLLRSALTLIVLVQVSAVLARSQTSSSNEAQAGGRNMSFTVSSSSFANGGDIPAKFSCDGADVSPQLSWSNPPAGTKTIALLADDPDAPAGNWNHWVMWNLPAEVHDLAEGMSKSAHLGNGTEQGTNDFKKIGYNGPCPPAGKPHRYYFKLYALDTKLSLNESAGKRELEAAVKGHILGQTEWMGRYKRK